ncbi:MAG: polysaccharide deacetylase family protein [Rhodomicrobiaceae bacterium]
MRFKQALLSNLANVSRIGGLGELAGRRHRGAGAIIVAHSVVEDPGEYLFDHLRTSAAFLETILDHLRKAGIDIVPLDEAMRRLRENDARRFACFTFDDGYKDNLTVALPIFERYEAPFTVYVTTCHIEGTIDNWWSGLAEILRNHERIEVEELGGHYEARTLQEKARLYRQLKQAAENGTLSAAGISAFLKAYSIDMPEIVARDALTLDELRELSSSPLVEIGAHTASHPRLSELGEAEAQFEMATNKEWLEDLLQHEIRHFAYPYGDPGSCGLREAKLAKMIGFDTAVTTRIGNLFAAHCEFSTALPRIRLFSSRENINLVQFQLSGAAGALLNRAHGPVVTM